MKDMIREEMRIAKEKYGNSWRQNYFDNFHAHLPGGFRRRYSDEVLNFVNHEYNGKSLRAVFEEIDSIINNIGISVDKIMSLQKHGLDNKNKLLDLCFPVYIRLRELGYRKTDLSA